MVLLTDNTSIPVENGTDVLLLLLISGGNRKTENEEIMGNTRLVKLVFLLEQETTFKKYLGDFSYDAYNFGPFSSELYDALQALISAGLVNARRSESDGFLDEADRYQVERQTISESDSPQGTIIYSLTDEGITVAKGLYLSLTDEEKNELYTLKKRFNTIGLRRLLQYVYRKYPSYTTESVIKDYIY